MDAVNENGKRAMKEFKHG
nr:Zgc:158506 protein [Danio rerio]